MTEDTQQQEYRSLLSIRARKMELKKELNASEKEVKKLWKEIFHPSDDMPKTTTQRLMSLASSSMGVIDGAILGWKLYKKFKK